ncbi:MAG TPA: response regulator [Pirellulales bacterium]|nr:response regulator [Pirellulales bacterium]
MVDDEQDTCANLHDILTDLGYQVDTANDGEAALALVAQQPYDVALLDLKMPGMDGLELYRRIKALRSGTVAIVVTAYATSETAKAALDAGAWQVLSKPVDFGHLLKMVNDAIEQPLVLVVDDDRELCETLWDLFREHQCRVCIAHHAAEAEARLQEQRFQVVLIDMKLPGPSGREVFRLVRKADAQARTVLITGRRSETDELVKTTLAEGADAACYKPFDVSQLLTTLKRLAGSTPADTER